ncbi:peptidyl-prolyl cis-trans FKDP-type domain-containing protein [Cyclospora cayetanensis]|uniref:Peptidyl-prolyl cis-trans FKDP-type domain-containing protein n=1 Tax=Cyclospora cayetanensis TaxID=88456 RepID=A0A1D3CUV7_9EIME|nr:peptidyl-prolyl cis-trans FKDP-type domain-containing protein [Cyclospora cayetanensis]
MSRLKEVAQCMFRKAALGAAAAAAGPFGTALRTAAAAASVYSSSGELGRRTCGPYGSQSLLPLRGSVSVPWGTPWRPVVVSHACNCAGIDKQVYLEKKAKRVLYVKSRFGFQYVDKTEGEGEALCPGDFAWVEFEGRKALSGELFETSRTQGLLLSLLLRPFKRGSPLTGGPYKVRVKDLGIEGEEEDSHTQEMAEGVKAQGLAGEATGEDTEEGAAVIEGIARGICGMKRGGSLNTSMVLSLSSAFAVHQVLIYEAPANYQGRRRVHSAFCASWLGAYNASLWQLEAKRAVLSILRG